MANGNIPLSISLSLRGQNTVARALGEQQKIITDTKFRYEALAKSGTLSMKQQANAAVAMREKIANAEKEMRRIEAAGATTAVQKYQQNMQARAALGIRAEKLIQAEIKKTEAAYQHLANSGVLSARELARAQEASTRKVRELKKELDGAEQGYGRINKLALAGAAAGAYAMTKPAVDKAVNYDRTVASMTNTMFADRDAAGRIAGKAEIKGAIDNALKVGGGTREQAAGTLNELIGSGEFTKTQAYQLTGTIQKGATATGADSSDLANIALGAKRMGIKPEDIDKALSKAIRSGQLGGFELKDMARHLPEVLSSARELGLTGMAGFERVLVSMQSSVLTAGTKDGAANNLVNLLEKINSQDTATDFANHGIDLRKELVAGAGRGEDTITTFTKLIDHVIAKDPKSKATTQELARLQALAEDKKNPMREQALKQIEAIYASGVIGKFLQDRQALQGFRAETQGGESGLQKNVREGLRRDDAAQELNTSYAVMNDTASKKLQDFENNKLKGQDDMLTGAGGVVKPLFDGMVELSSQYPVMTASVVAAKDALMLLAGAAVLNATLGGGKLPKIPGVPKAAGAGFSSVLGGGTLGTLSAAAAPLLAMYGVTQWAGDTSKDKQRAGSLLDVSDMLNKLMGLDPNKAQSEWRAKKNAEIGIAPQVEINQTIGLAPGLVITSQTTKANGVKHSSNTGNIHHGAP